MSDKDMNNSLAFRQLQLHSFLEAFPGLLSALPVKGDLVQLCLVCCLSEYRYLLLDETEVQLVAHNRCLDC